MAELERRAYKCRKCGVLGRAVGISIYVNDIGGQHAPCKHEWIPDRGEPAESFANHPKSVAEARSDKSRNAADWTPRDVLIDLLRSIDAGVVKPTALIVCYRSDAPDAKASDTCYTAASPSIHVSLGLLDRTKWMINVGAVDA